MMPLPEGSSEQKRSHAHSSRKKRSDAGTTIFNTRDESAFTWIGLQYGIRLDHLQSLLGRFPGKGAPHHTWISESAARDVVERWKRGRWVQQARIRAHEPFWVWPTRLGLRMVGLPYRSRDLARTGLGWGGLVPLRSTTPLPERVLWRKYNNSKESAHVGARWNEVEQARPLTTPFLSPLKNV